MVGLAGYWNLADAPVQNLRYCQCMGGFLFADSFFGSCSRPEFANGIKHIPPEYNLVDLDSSDAVFQTVDDLTVRAQTQIPNMHFLIGGADGWLDDGSEPHWHGLLDDKGRLLAVG